MSEYQKVIKRLQKKSHSKEVMPNGLMVKFVKRANYYEFQLGRVGVSPSAAEVKMFTSALQEVGYVHISQDNGTVGWTIDKKHYGVCALRAVKGV